MQASRTDFNRINLLLAEDFGFAANGSIASTISSLVPELSTLCGLIIWVVPDSKVVFRSQFGCLPNVRIVSLKPSLFARGWFAYHLARIIGKLAKIKSLRKLERFLASRAKKQRLESIISKYHLTHYLNLGIFNQKFLALSIPVFGIVYDYRYSKMRYEIRADNLRKWCRRSAGIFTISKSSRHEVAAAVNPRIGNLFTDSVAAGNLLTVPLAVSSPFKSTALRRLTSTLCKCPVFLFPSSLAPQKNHSALLEALSILHADGYHFKLLLCGYSTDKLLARSVIEDSVLESARLIFRTSNFAFRSSVEIHGFVDQDQLERLYLRADYVVLPSRHEGFGLPLTEAIVRGVPVICSDLPAFREQLKLYGISQGVRFVASSRAADWASVIKKELDRPFDQRLVAPDISDVLARWSWNDVARSYLNLMQKKSRRL